MNRKVVGTIQAHGMIRRGDRVYAALSGGADSVTLLHILLTLCSRMDFTLTALHLNHNLRGRESRRDELFVRALCRRWGVPLVVESLPVAAIAKRRGLSVEECARRLRYAFFRRHAGGADARIATGHTRNDTVETVLLNLIRGTGLRGLCGIPPVRGNIIRPLIDCGRHEVEEYCARRRLPFVTDSTNLSHDYTRNRIRHQLVPLLNGQNPRFEAHTASMTADLRADADFLDALADEALKGLETGADRWSRSAFLELPGPLRPRVLRSILTANGLRYDRDRLTLLERVIGKGRGGVQLSPALQLSCSQDYFTLAEPGVKPHRHPPASDDRVVVIVPDVGKTVKMSLFRGKQVLLSTVEYENYKKSINIGKKLLKNALDCDRIEKILNLRHPKPADRLRPMGRGCTKTMKNLWSEQGVKPERRREYLALAGNEGLLWVEGFGPDERYTPCADTRRVLVIELLS